MRRLGNTGLEVSELGVGCQSIGGGLYHRDDAESLRLLHAALDAGINFFDTSDHYSQGQSERLLGRAFRDRRDRVLLATKAGTLYSNAASLALRARTLLRPLSRFARAGKLRLHRLRAAQKRQDFSPDALRRAVEASFGRLQTDHIDLFQLHKPPAEVLARGEFCDTLEALTREGKIRHWGVALHHADAARHGLLCLSLPGIACVQVQINLLDQTALHELVPCAQARGVGVLARNPRDQGHLTDDRQDIMAETYHADRRAVAARMARAESFRFLVRDGRTLAQAALQFALQSPAVAAALPRLYRRSHLAETLGAATAPPLTPEELRRISAIDAATRADETRE